MGRQCFGGSGGQDFSFGRPSRYSSAGIYGGSFVSSWCAVWPGACTSRKQDRPNHGFKGKVSSHRTPSPAVWFGIGFSYIAGCALDGAIDGRRTLCPKFDETE